MVDVQDRYRLNGERGERNAESEENAKKRATGEGKKEEKSDLVDRRPPYADSVIVARLRGWQASLRRAEPAAPRDREREEPTKKAN